MPRRGFAVWATILAFFWVLANCPQSIGLPNTLWIAGFPFGFAVWLGSEVREFYPEIMLLDCAIGAVVVLGLSRLIVWARKADKYHVVES